MKRRKQTSLLLILCLLFLLLSGCWDRKELEDQAFVVTIGIDKGKQNQLLVTFRIGIPSKSGLGQTGGGGQGGEGSIAEQASLLTTVAAPTIPAAIMLAQGYVNREINLLHTKAVIFGESFARDGVGPILSILARFRELRRNVFICVTEGSAYKLLENNEPDLEKSYAKYWEGVKLMHTSGAIHSGTLFHDFITESARADRQGTMIYLAVNEGSKKGDPGEIKVPDGFLEGQIPVKAGEIPRKGGNKVEYLGTAVFKGDKMKLILDLTETQSLLMLSGNFHRTLYTVPDPEVENKYIPLEIKQGSLPRISVSIQGDKIKIKETLSLEGDLIAIQSKINYAESHKSLEKLNQAVESNLRSRLEHLLQKLKKEGMDSVGYGSYVKRHFLTEKEWTEFNWSDKFKDAEITLDVNFSIRRTGMQGKQPGPIVY